MKKISIAIPTYNRTVMTVESFIDVYSDDRISEIIIVDDASEEKYFNELSDICDNLTKVKIYRNDKNLDCYENKYTSVSHTTNDYCILLDSDNKIDKSYIDAIYSCEWNPDVILTPSFAKPHFDFRRYAGLTISKENVSPYIDMPLFETMLNAANYFVNKKEYMNTWDRTAEPVTSDSIFMCYNWLKSGKKIFVVPGLEYQHEIHDGSHYKNNVYRTPAGFHQSIIDKLKNIA